MKLSLSLALILALLSTTACNTFEGFGKDVEHAGQAITSGASNTKENMKDEPQQQPPQQQQQPY